MPAIMAAWLLLRARYCTRNIPAPVNASDDKPLLKYFDIDKREERISLRMLTISGFVPIPINYWYNGEAHTQL